MSVFFAFLTTPSYTRRIEQVKKNIIAWTLVTGIVFPMQGIAAQADADNGNLKELAAQHCDWIQSHDEAAISKELNVDAPKAKDIKNLGKDICTNTLSTKSTSGQTDNRNVAQYKFAQAANNTDAMVAAFNSLGRSKDLNSDSFPLPAVPQPPSSPTGTAATTGGNGSFAWGGGFTAGWLSNSGPNGLNTVGPGADLIIRGQHSNGVFVDFRPGLFRAQKREGSKIPLYTTDPQYEDLQRKVYAVPLVTLGYALNKLPIVPYVGIGGTLIHTVTQLINLNGPGSLACGTPYGCIANFDHHTALTPSLNAGLKIPLNKDKTVSVLTDFLQASPFNRKLRTSIFSFGILWTPQ